MGHGCCAFFWCSAIRNLEALKLGVWSHIQDATLFAVRSFAELGLVLMIMTFAVNVIARMLVSKVWHRSAHRQGALAAMSKVNTVSLPSPAGPIRTASSTSAWPPMNQPFKFANVLSYNAALILLVIVLLIILPGRVAIALSRRNAE